MIFQAENREDTADDGVGTPLRAQDAGRNRPHPDHGPLRAREWPTDALLFFFGTIDQARSEAPRRLSMTMTPCQPATTHYSRRT